MGSSRRNFPPPIPYGYGSYQQGTDSSGTGAVMPKGMMPDNYTPQTQQSFGEGSSMGGIYGAMDNITKRSQQGSLTNALGQGSNYSPFFMRF